MCFIKPDSKGETVSFRRGKKINPKGRGVRTPLSFQHLRGKVEPFSWGRKFSLFLKVKYRGKKKMINRFEGKKGTPHLYPKKEPAHDRPRRKKEEKKEPVFLQDQNEEKKKEEPLWLAYQPFQHGRKRGKKECARASGPHHKARESPISRELWQKEGRGGRNTARHPDQGPPGYGLTERRGNVRAPIIDQGKGKKKKEKREVEIVSRGGRDTFSHKASN